MDEGCAKKNHTEWSRIQKGKPQQNAIIERFNKTYREDVLMPICFTPLNKE
ncbi:MAG: integrase core domain-containing protein [Cyclobacteriaceae bacterium]|nr:integrase core domain-containing protein [Cyclobacteriaceae bacterium]